MTGQSSIVCLIVLAVMTTAIPANAEDVQSVLDHCGHTVALGKLGREIEGVRDKAVGTLHESVQASVSASLESALAVNELYGGYRRELQELSAAEVHDVARWCASAVGQRIVAAEEKESPEERPDDVIGRALKSIRSAKNPAVRRDQIATIVNVSRLNKAMPETMAMVAAIFLGAEELAKPEGERLAHSDFIRALIDIARDMQADLTPVFEAEVVNTYAEVSEEDLQVYVLFLQTPAGQAWARAGHRGLHQYLASAVRSIAHVATRSSGNTGRPTNK